MNKKTTSGFTVMEVICCLPLLTAIFIELPLPLQILLPFVSFVSGRFGTSSHCRDSVMEAEDFSRRSGVLYQ